MGDAVGETDRGALRLDFDRRLMLRFPGSAITSDGRLLDIASWTTCRSDHNRWRNIGGCTHR